MVLMVEALLVEQVVLNGSSSTDLFEALRKNAPEIYTFPKTNECLLKENTIFLLNRLLFRGLSLVLGGSMSFSFGLDGWWGVCDPCSMLRWKSFV